MLFHRSLRRLAVLLIFIAGITILIHNLAAISTSKNLQTQYPVSTTQLERGATSVSGWNDVSSTDTTPHSHATTTRYPLVLEALTYPTPTTTTIPNQPSIPTQILTITVEKTHTTIQTSTPSIHPTSTNAPRPFSPRLDNHPTSLPPPGRQRPHLPIPPPPPKALKQRSPPPTLPISTHLHPLNPLNPPTIPGSPLNKPLIPSSELLRAFGFIVAGLLVGACIGLALKACFRPVVMSYFFAARDDGAVLRGERGGWWRRGRGRRGRTWFGREGV
jgi:hypothetical protein